MFLVRMLRAIVRFAPLPVFLALAAVNYHLESMGAGHGAHDGPHGGGGEMAGHAMSGGMATDPAAWLTHPALGTMWLMYLLMALAHAGAWLGKGKRTGA